MALNRILLFSFGVLLLQPLFLLSREDSGEKFKELAREELSRLKKLEEEKNGGVNESLETGKLFKNQTPPALNMPPPIPALEEETEKEKREKEEEEEASKNWLIDGVEKLSGERELTDEEKASLRAAGSGTRLIDRMVAEREAEKEKEKAASKRKDEAMAEAFPDLKKENWFRGEEKNHKNKKAMEDPLKSLENQYLATPDGEMKSHSWRRETQAMEGLKENPYLKTLKRSPDFKRGKASGSLARLNVIGEDGRIPQPIPRVLASPSLKGVDTFGMSDVLKNPYLGSIGGIRNNMNNPYWPAGTLPPILNAPGLKPIPLSSEKSRSRIALPKAASPTRPQRLTDEENKMYFPQLNRY